MNWFAERALLPAGLAHDVLFEISDGRFTAVRPGASPGEARRLPGVALPGFANGHSHAFHRALRGRTHSGGSFWTWREAMYAIADRLDPDSYTSLARATYAEMALAGVTSVGEFHYLHHATGGHRYAEPNAMGAALVQGAREAGIRLTLLDTCYLTGGLSGDGYAQLTGTQLRFGDADVDGWAARVAGLRSALRGDDTTVIGAAIHSVRAVPGEQLAGVVTAAAGAPLHVHLSEQPAENDACLARHHCTPTQLLASAGVLGPSTTAVHATHLTPADVGLLAQAAATACFCPTTERDLGDGIGPARDLADSGVTLSLGSDQQVVIDMFEEARGLEMHERLRTGQRGRFSPAALLEAMTEHRSLGRPDAGRLAVGALADIVAVRLDSVRTAGSDPAQIVLSAGAADIDTVVVGGRAVVSSGHHVLGDVARLLDDAIAPLWDRA